MGLKITGLVKFIPSPQQQPGGGDENLTIQNASYSGVSFDVSGQDNNPQGISFNDDGTKMFMVGAINDSVHQYTLGTGFDLSTASYDNVSFNVSGQTDFPMGIAFNLLGTKMFMVDTGSGDNIRQYTLGTGFDLTTASFDNVSFDVSGQEGSPRGIFLNSTGTKMFVTGNQNDSVYQYTLGTGFDLSTASYDSVSFDVSNQDGNPRGIFFNSTGTRMFMIGRNSDSVYQYTLGTGFDLSTVSFDSISIDISGQDTSPQGIFFNSAGTRMFVVGATSDSVHQYDL